MSRATEKLMTKVTARLYVAALSHRLALCVLALGAVYALLLILVKGFSLVGDVLAWWTVLVLPVAGGALALLSTRRPSKLEAAWLVDRRMQSQDLFLTAALLDAAPGDYKPLVRIEAEQRATDVNPAQMVPFAVNRRGVESVGAVGLLMLATLLPAFDPFGLHAQREIHEQRREELSRTMQTTEVRKAALQQQNVAAERSAEVDQAVQQLKQTLQQMRRDDQRANMARLRDRQAQLNDVYKRSLEKRQAEQNSRRNRAIQQLGATPNQDVRQMMQQAAQGDADALKAKLEESKQKLAEASRSGDEAERRDLAEQVRRELQQMQSAAEQDGANALSEALNNALQQMRMAGMEGLSSEAMSAAMDSLDLAQMELDQFAQMAMDAEAMRQAMEALQMAMQACEMGTLDGEPCQGLGDMSEYMEQLVLMCQGGGGGVGVGLVDGGGGDGAGGRGAGWFGSGGMGEPADHSGEVASTDVRAPGRFVAGSTIMSWKTQESSQDGEARREYVQAVDEVRQAVSAAVVPEDVPPGYREVIESYLAHVERDLQPAAPKE